MAETFDCNNKEAGCFGQMQQRNSENRFALTK
jgi:hypothetical protein